MPFAVPLSHPAGGPATSCGTGKNVIQFPNAYTGGTVNPLTNTAGSMLPAAQISNTAALMLKAGLHPLAEH